MMDSDGWYVALERGNSELKTEADPLVTLQQSRMPWYVAPSETGLRYCALRVVRDSYTLWTRVRLV